ncbi:hypothetical protein NIES2135_20630 [Leptolyngbya boryana NIES-2135]|jgi:hypothetical protein|uniref:Uncharacterized protein n=1 Tax=Leptolyngbya boryana NIES-2135 TaxID=1973484 RepID=A0A1Z4JEU5_LEPBY|nr:MULTISPECIES: hypothetical protein [Leptolyngbya]BAY55240.1 hypothetical protein NIES2135_20630 [Leptolyngbya boryana NIES-2135]MBD2369325.1 hypothetical protein [Leptolyngbya sp. FACHB-161]MBD2375673.1 hypothetical protein [Leptolyngbya sp. FACHB-238]MBD2401654.1 hypothetical protein [Leptolyngbya sp. FACHB-239]MBD2406607.1 hypothetical protein [Leptolyngbya sp. FACHB-402]
MHEVIPERFRWAIAKVEQVYPDLYTPKGLSELLSSAMFCGTSSGRKRVKIELLKDEEIYYGLAGLDAGDFAKNFLRRFAADPKGWALDAPEEVQEGAGWYQKLGSFIKPEGMASIMLYHQIRDHVQLLQQEKQISGIVGERETGLLGHYVTVVDFNDQLLQLPEDLSRIADSAKKVVQLFLDVMPAQQDRYALYKDATGDDKTYEPVGLSEVLSLLNAATEASLYSECQNWRVMEEGGWRSVSCDRNPDLDPDEIRLTIDTENDSHRFIAESRDASRFPWRNH